MQQQHINWDDGPPINRERLDRTRKPFRLAAAILMIGYSLVATVREVSEDVLPALAVTLPESYAIGIAVALVIFIGQIITAERSQITYFVLTGIDAYYTERASDWVDRIVQSMLKVEGQYSQQIEGVISFIVSWAFAIAVAYYGERLLFGKRRNVKIE